MNECYLHANVLIMNSVICCVYGYVNYNQNPPIKHQTMNLLNI